MKNILIIGILILSNSVFGQIPGKTIEGPIVIFDTLTIKEGDIIFLGKGSDHNTGNFIHITTPRQYLTVFSGNKSFQEFKNTSQGISNSYNGSSFAIQRFSKVSSKKKGDMILGVIEIGGSFDGIKLNLGMYKQAVNFEAAILAGEIIKISAPELTEKAARELLFSPFVMTNKGIEPVVVAFNNLSGKELYNKAINWTNSYYKIPNQSTITSVSDVKIIIKDFAKNVKFGTFMGKDLFADVPYLLTVDFTDNEIRMTFTLGGENGDITNEKGEVVANISPSRIFNNNGEVRIMSQDFKVEAEKIMNDLSYAMVYYLMK